MRGQARSQLRSEARAHTLLAFAIAAFALTFLRPHAAWSQASNEVVILRPVGGSQQLQEAVTRLQAELGASSFAVSIRQRHPDAKVLAYEAGAVMALRPTPLAAVSVAETNGELTAALWRIDDTTKKPVAWSVSVRGDAAPATRGAAAPAAVLAIRTVELLHASLTGVLIDAPQLFPPPPPKAETPKTADEARLEAEKKAAKRRTTRLQRPLWCALGFRDLSSQPAALSWSRMIALALNLEPPCASGTRVQVERSRAFT